MCVCVCLCVHASDTPTANTCSWSASGELSGWMDEKMDGQTEKMDGQMDG